MPEIRSNEQLLSAYEQYKKLLSTRLGAEVDETTVMILVCGGTGCHASESQKLVDNFQRLIADHGLQGKVYASIAGCFGFCEKGPIVKIFPENVFYVQVKPEDAIEIFEQHIVNGHKVRKERDR